MLTPAEILEQKRKDAAAQDAANGAANGAGTEGMNNLTKVTQGDTVVVSAVTPAATGIVPKPAAPAPVTDVKEVAVAKLKDEHTYMHIFAGANTIMPSGKKLTFNGRPGSVGYYTTIKEDEIAFLDELAETGGSQISKEERALLIDNEFNRERTEAYTASTVNSAQQLDKNVVAAQDNLAKTIAATHNSN